MNLFWTDERHAALKRLIEVDGLTAEQAAATLGTTRGAVIGRAYRHDLVFARSPYLAVAKLRAASHPHAQERRRCAL